MTATVTKGTTDKISVKASKPSAVKVTVKGKKITVKGKKKGKLTITVKCGSKTQKIKVTVK